jgi:hypothetical protein
MRIKEKASQLSKINFRYIKYRKKGLMKFWYVFNPIFGHGIWCRLVQLFWSRSRIVAHLLRTQNAATRAQQKGYKSRKEPKMTDVKI